MFSIYQMISNTNPAISLQESDFDIIALEGINDETEEIDVGVIGTDSYKHMASRFASLPDEERHPTDRYAVPREQEVMYQSRKYGRGRRQTEIQTHFCAY
jgi:hypothetical protein